jgi:non-homologous end joining protein Ku
MEHYALNLNHKEKLHNLSHLKRVLDVRKLPMNSPEINDRYRKNLLALSTDKLNIIVEAAEASNRKQETVDAIMTELFERSVSETRKDS